MVPQINKAMAKAGIAGANGYYYPPNDPVQPMTRSKADAAMKR